MFMALGALVIIAVLVAGSSYVSMQEARLGQNSLIQSRAFAVAEYGLNKIQADWDKTPNLEMNNGESFDTSYTLAGQGTCTVRYTRLNNETFWIVSEGRALTGNALSANREAIKRVGAIMRLRIPTIKAEAAITAGGNVLLRGGAAVNGNDANPPGWNDGCTGSLKNKSGIIVPQGSTASTQGSSTIAGTPPWKTDPLAADENTYIRYGDETWNTLVAQADIKINGGTIGNAVAPTVAAGYCDRSNIYNWGEPHREALVGLGNAVPECYNYFPIIYSNGDITLNGGGRGQGILLVQGNVQINGRFEWHGLIVVTNDIVRGNGSALVYGSVMAKNEVKTDNSILSGTTEYRFSSCALERAMRGSAQVVQGKERAWTELY
jgi:hypothetical protein